MKEKMEIMCCLSERHRGSFATVITIFQLPTLNLDSLDILMTMLLERVVSNVRQLVPDHIFEQICFYL